ncbi:phosphoribosylformylglycinamidine synthase I [Candidatus Micrarchaeota archaeon]|nr:phosphoribosylformylglycinamidine synthase I [Candidatus Micrarchaeota archaeon]
MEARTAVITGFGINSEYETHEAVKMAGGYPDYVHLNHLIKYPSLLDTYNFVVFPGGFSFADHLGSAKVLSNKIFYKLNDSVQRFIKEGKLILGICNGFQVLVKMGILPYPTFEQKVTLTLNESGKFEDRWVHLKANKNSPCVFTKGIDFIDLPVRHGEGKFVCKDEEIVLNLINNNLIALQYVDENAQLAGYPYNPNGSIHNIAGICDATGRIMGLMPHPECYLHKTNHPLWTRFGEIKPFGVKLFENAVNYINSNL